MSVVKSVYGRRIAYTAPTLENHACILFPRGHISAYIVGLSGSGKSVLLLSLVPNIENIASILYLSLIVDNPVCKAIQGYADANHIKFVTHNEPETSREALEKFVNEREEGKSNLVIADDFVLAQQKSDHPSKILLTAITQLLRNYRFHNICISQSVKAFPDNLRNNSNLRIIFNCASVLALKAVAQEFSTNGFGSMRYFYNLYDTVLQGGRFSYMALVSDAELSRIYVHLHSKGEDSLFAAPLHKRDVQLINARAYKPQSYAIDARRARDESDDDDD